MAKGTCPNCGKEFKKPRASNCSRRCMWDNNGGLLEALRELSDPMAYEHIGKFHGRKRPWNIAREAIAKAEGTPMAYAAHKRLWRQITGSADIADALDSGTAKAEEPTA